MLSASLSTLKTQLMLFIHSNDEQNSWEISGSLNTQVHKHSYLKGNSTFSRHHLFYYCKCEKVV